MRNREILRALPYSPPFLFVDEVEEVNETSCKGNYTFPEDSFFYRGHFKDFPVTPGVILTECMAQIGLVCFGLHLLRGLSKENLQVAFTSVQVEFLQPVMPKERVVVVSHLIYFRFNKLKCAIKMYNHSNEVVAKGEFAGIFNPKP